MLRTLDAARLVIAPELMHVETANALWQQVRHGLVDVEVALERLDLASELIDRRFDDRELVGEALVAAARHQHPVYDMLYAVLARRFGATVLTLDRRFRKLLHNMNLESFPTETL